MSDMTASAGSQMGSMASHAATTSAQQGVKTTVALTNKSARVSAHVAHRTAGGTVRALVAIIDTARTVMAGSNREQGRVGLKQFTKITDGKREILPVNEKEVAREFARELRKHGVTFAIERHPDGSRTFHVEGKEAAVVEHALAQASARVDDRLTREAARRSSDEPEAQQQQPEQVTEDLTPEQAKQERVTLDHAGEAGELSLASEEYVDLPEHDEMPEPEVMLQLDRREQAALVQALDGAPHREALAEQIQSEAQVALSRENVATLNTVIAEQGWTPEHGEMGWVAESVGREHDRLAPPTVDNPWLSVEPARAHDAPVIATDANPFAPGEWEGREPQAEGHTPQERGVQEPPAKQQQVLDLDEGERSALADELRRYADYREGDLGLDTTERAAELSNDPTYAYDQQATTEALEHEQAQIEQFQQEQVAAASPYRELADQVERTGRLDLTDDAMRRDVTEVIDNTGWSLDGEVQDAPPQTMQRVVEAVRAPRQPEQERGAGIDANPFAPGEWEGREPQAEAHIPSRTTEKPVVQEPPVEPETRSENDRTPQHDRDRQLSPRDATRERVAKQIDTKSEAIKKERGTGHTKNRAVPRNPKVTR